ncbi:class I SAM-dependent methyltransferase [Caldisericum sp.]|uniref:class I SAM-dependent methyltransferase n=1 Tax=Caldisericum sp. TaxID=2499687 RepID=UPI003D0CC377
MDWTKDYFDDIYLKYFLLAQKEERTKEQVDFIEKFLEKDSYILDAGCGIGRHSIELAKRGYKVLGIDTSPIYIKVANETKSQLKLENALFDVMDMRELSFENTFDAIINMWSSFGYFDDGTNEHILRLFFQALKKNGFLIIDIENRDYILKYFIRETFKEREDGIFILERRKFNPVTSVVSTHRYIVGPNIRKDYLRHIRIYSLTEMINIFKQVGFSKLEYYGNYNFEKFHVDSERILIIGFK